MAVNKRGIDTTGMSNEELGIAHWGFNPDQADSHFPSVLHKLCEAFDRNRQAVHEAKQKPLDGDWVVTRFVLTAARALGVIVTRNH